jgi:uncharacterized membrane protein
MSFQLIISLVGLVGILAMLTPALKDARKKRRLWLVGVLLALTAHPALFVAQGIRPIPWSSLLIALGSWLSLVGWTLYAQRGALFTARKPTRPE